MGNIRYTTDRYREPAAAAGQPGWGRERGPLVLRGSGEARGGRPPRPQCTEGASGRTFCGAVSPWPAAPGRSGKSDGARCRSNHTHLRRVRPESDSVAPSARSRRSHRSVTASTACRPPPRRGGLSISLRAPPQEAGAPRAPAQALATDGAAAPAATAHRRISPDIAPCRLGWRYLCGANRFERQKQSQLKSN